MSEFACDVMKSAYMGLMAIFEVGDMSKVSSPKHAVVYGLANVAIRDVARRIGESYLFEETVQGFTGNFLFICGIGIAGGVCLNRLMGRVTNKDLRHLDGLSLITSSFSGLFYLVTLGGCYNEFKKQCMVR